MQLRRGPPTNTPAAPQSPPLRLIKAPLVAARAPRAGGLWKPLKSYSIRVVAAMLLVTIPLFVALGVVIQSWSTQTSIAQAKTLAEATAQSAAVRITDWVEERQAELQILAQNQVGALAASDVESQLRPAGPSHPSFESLQVFDAKGAIVGAPAPGTTLSATPADGTVANTLSVETSGPAPSKGGQLISMPHAPIPAPHAQPLRGVAA